MNNTSVDSYLADGCGRCEHYQTPACKVHRWAEPLKALRALVLEAGLTEAMKWGAPCYALDGKNVVMVTAFVDCCAVSFFKGAALADEHGVLELPGPNSRIARLVRLRSLEELEARRDVLAALIQQAIEVERSGVSVSVDEADEPMPEELQARLEEDPALSAAFASLTPGRQRSHVLYVSSAKQSRTRAIRVERCVPKILAGRGFQER